MIQKITTERIPLKLWLHKLEPGALQQAKDLANLEIAFRHIAIMPDAHQGYGMLGVLATSNCAKHSGCGCGMCSLKQI